MGAFEYFTIPPLQIEEININHSNILIKFNENLNLESLNLYKTHNNKHIAPDITLVGETIDRVNTSFVWDESTTTMTLILTGEVFKPNNYTLTLASREDGLLTIDGGLLDDRGNAGGDYSYEFTIEETGDTILSMPDLTLAPGANKNIPVTLDNVEGANKVEFDLYYDRNFLDITAVNRNSNLPTSWQLTESEIDSDNGIINITIEGTDALTGNNLNLVDLEAVVPDTATYGATQVLDLENVVLNDGNISAMDDDAVHQIMQAGDVTGDNKVDNLDAYQMMRVSVGLDDGFVSFPTIDPAIFADLNQDGIISAFDAYYAVNN
ncbi:MAG: hypothetical protein Tsb0014_27590 [Pleurocapsa sp.]